MKTTLDRSHPVARATRTARRTPAPLTVAWVMAFVVLIAAAATRVGVAFWPSQTGFTLALDMWAWRAAQASSAALIVTAVAWTGWRLAARRS